MKFYTIFRQTNPNPSTSPRAGTLNVQGLWLLDKNLFCSHIKSKRPLSFWRLLNGCFSSFNWIEDFGVFSLFSKIAFLKTGIIMIFHSVFVGLGCFSLEEKHTHTGIIHLPTNLQDTKCKVLAKSGQQLPAAPAVIPPGPCPVRLPITWSLTRNV